MSNCNQINTPANTVTDLRLPYKQEVGGSSPSAPTTSQQLAPPNVKPDPLPEEGSGSLSETLTRHCPCGCGQDTCGCGLEGCTHCRPACACGKASAGWPGDGDAELCQDCWEAACSESWWRAHNAYASQAPPRYRGIVFTGTTQAGPRGTETQTAHQQCTFPDPATADTWLTERVNATGKEGVLLIQREEALRCYRPKETV